MVKHITNIPEVLKQVKDANIPKEYNLSEFEIIKDTHVFITQHLNRIDVPKLTRFHRPYFDRLNRLLKTFNITLIVEENTKYKKR